jgi:hypothetical protein
VVRESDDRTVTLAGEWAAVRGARPPAGTEGLRIACPDVAVDGLDALLASAPGADVELLTRLDLRGFAAGHGDLEALMRIVERGGHVRGVRSLAPPAGADTAGSHAAAARWFDELWERAGADADVALRQLERWEEQVELHLLRGAPPEEEALLADAGRDLGLPPAPVPAPVWRARADQAFVKFFGNARNRAPRTLSTLDLAERSGAHWTCCYPRGKRPRAVRDGATLFHGRLVRGPDDILVVGRATALAHVDGRDDASMAEIGVRPWRERWPHYIRNHHLELLDGAVGDGLSLAALMAELGPESFASTERNLRAGSGNTDPRRAYGQQAAVELTPRAQRLLDERLDERFAACGTIPAAVLDGLEWPDPPVLLQDALGWPEPPRRSPGAGARRWPEPVR